MVTMIGLKTPVKTDALLNALESVISLSPERALVIGCGSGMEAGIIAQRYKADTVGIDTNASQFEYLSSKPASLEVMNAEKLEFEDNSLDFVYSFHALEHILNCGKALREMARVLRPNGVYCIGTPNSSRLIGYLGSETSLRNKLLWNIIDWKMRLTGRWKNNLGAHAGFKTNELIQMCHESFNNVVNISNEYYDCIGGYRAQISRLSSTIGISKFVHPCVYVCGTNKSG